MIVNSQDKDSVLCRDSEKLLHGWAHSVSLNGCLEERLMSESTKSESMRQCLNSSSLRQGEPLVITDAQSHDLGPPRDCMTQELVQQREVFHD